MNPLEKLENNFLLAPKILYLIVNLQYYTLHQFRNQFAQFKFGISTGEYGKFNGYIQAFTFFTNIYIGSLSDRTGKHKLTLMFLTVITCGLVMLFYAIPKSTQGPATLSLKNSATLFWLVLLGYLIFNNPKQPLFDKIILDYLSDIPGASNSYGKQRLWGTVAYAMATFIVENLITANSSGPKTADSFNWTNLIYYSVFTTIATILCLMTLIKTKNRTRSIRSTSGYLILMKNKEYAFFIFIMFMNAVTRQAMSNYLGSFFTNILVLQPYKLPSNWPSSLKFVVNIFNRQPMTTLTIFGTSCEILSMFFASRIIDKFGFFVPLLGAQFVALFRFIAYYFMDKDGAHVYAYACLIEVLKGIYFGLAHMPAIQIAKRLSPRDLEATSQMIYQGTFGALGAAISGHAFSFVFDSALKSKKSRNVEINSFQTLFLVNIGLSLFTISLYILKYGFIDKALFSREAEERKLSQIEEMENIELENDMNNAQNNVNRRVINSN